MTLGRARKKQGRQQRTCQKSRFYWTELFAVRDTETTIRKKHIGGGWGSGRRGEIIQKHCAFLEGEGGEFHGNDMSERLHFLLSFRPFLVILQAPRIVETGAKFESNRPLFDPPLSRYWAGVVSFAHPMTLQCLAQPFC